MAFEPDVDFHDGMNYPIRDNAKGRLPAEQLRWTNGRDSSTHSGKYLNEPSFGENVASRPPIARDRICDSLAPMGSVAVQLIMHL